jgi:hypothetical protein
MSGAPAASFTRPNFKKLIVLAPPVRFFHSQISKSLPVRSSGRFVDLFLATIRFQCQQKSVPATWHESFGQLARRIFSAVGFLQQIDR